MWTVAGIAPLSSNLCVSGYVRLRSLQRVGPRPAWVGSCRSSRRPECQLCRRASPEADRQFSAKSCHPVHVTGSAGAKRKLVIHSSTSRHRGTRPGASQREGKSQSEARGDLVATPAGRAPRRSAPGAPRSSGPRPARGFACPVNAFLTASMLLWPP